MGYAGIDGLGMTGASLGIGTQGASKGIAEPEPELALLELWGSDEGGQGEVMEDGETREGCPKRPVGDLDQGGEI